MIELQETLGLKHKWKTMDLADELSFCIEQFTIFANEK